MYFLGRRETILPKRISIPFQRRGLYPRGLPTTGLNLPVYLRQVFLPNGFLLSNADSSLFAALYFFLLSLFRHFNRPFDANLAGSCWLSSEDLFVRNCPTTKEINSNCRKSYLDRGIARVITSRCRRKRVDRSRRVSRSEESVRWPA